MGFPKALLRYRHQYLLERLVQMHRQIALQVFVILGEDHDQIARALDLRGVTVLLNPEPRRGPLSSLWTALPWLDGSSGILVHPVDHGLVSRQTIQDLRDLHSRSPRKIIIPKFQGEKGHPVIFPARFYPHLRRAPLQEGSRWVVRNHPQDVVYALVEDATILCNLNRPEDLPAGVTIPSTTSFKAS